MVEPPVTKAWQGHKGTVLASQNGFDVIECQQCGFKHIIPIPSVEELVDVYQHDYYKREKPLYLERSLEDLDWWNLVYTQRYEILERYLPDTQRSLLEIGSGPGFFLLNGQKRGWQVKGVEPSAQAAEHSRRLGLDVVNEFFSDRTVPALGSFDVISMALVLEHIPSPESLLKLVHRQLNNNGMVSIVVPNDFNPFQLVLRDHLGFKPWWIAPPHHINYFNFDSLSNLLEKCGFTVMHKESTFPIDMFLLMGDNYIGNDEVGRVCHTKRMAFEKSIELAGFKNTKQLFYKALAEAGLGREIVLVGRKNEESRC